MTTAETIDSMFDGDVQMSSSEAAVSRPIVEAGRVPGGRILIADDDPVALRVLERAVARAGFQAISVTDGSAAVARMSEEIDVALLDLRMPGLDGFQCLQFARQRFPETQVVMISSSHDVADAVEAMKLGAIDYFSKPFEYDELLARLRQAIATSRTARENRELRSVVETAIPVASFVAVSPKAQLLLERIERVSQLDGTVLLTGESGTGKSTLARMIHQLGPRKEKPFISINCASLPRELIEAELFGHARGAFTGAVKDRPGRAEIADQGTLFLDEIGDLPLELQPKLLTFLQDRVVQRIGSNQTRRVDVRVIAATHQNLLAMCRHQRFRQDLYYRLNVLELHVPSLRQRTDDIPEIAHRILRRIAQHHTVAVSSIDDDAVARLVSFDWPGNVRELENVLERAAAFARGPSLSIEDLEPLLNSWRESREEQGEVPLASLAGRTLEQIERQAIIDTLKHCCGNKARAARELGISEKSIYNKMKRLGISRKSEQRAEFGL